MDWKEKLICAYCGAECEDVQDDSKEEYKEEFCGNCNEQFGYQEKIEYEVDINNWDHMSEFPPKTKTKYYHTYTL